MAASQVDQSRKMKGRRRQMHIDSTQVENALNPVRGVRDALRRRGIEPRNYARQNIKAVQHASQMNALRKHQVEYCEYRPAMTPAQRSSVDSSKTISEEDAKNNYILRNILEVGTKGRRASSDDPQAQATMTKWTCKEGYGQVPNYIHARKVELAEEREAKQRAKEKAICPPGMRIIEGEEQRATLERIATNKITIETQLQNLPLLIETPSLMKRKTDLERRLMELEEAERIFSKPKVIVKV